MSIHFKRSLSLSALTLTPLIDVVFLLLIFFLLAGQYDREGRGNNLKLRRAEQAEPTTLPGKEITVRVSATGVITCDNEELSAEALEGKLAAAYANNPGRQHVTIVAAEDSRAGRLLTVMDACQRANIEDYAITTE